MGKAVVELANKAVDVDNGVVRNALVPVVKENDGAGIIEDNGNEDGVV